MAARTFRIHVAVGMFLLLAPIAARAQIPPGLDKGHGILLQRGLQIEAQSFTAGSSSNWTVSRWNLSNFTTINWQSDSQMPNYYSAPGAPWGRWADTNSNFSSSYSAPTSAEAPYASNYISLQLGDEQNLNTWTTDSNLRNNTIAWFAAARPNFTNTLLFLNQQGNEDSSTNIAAYMLAAQPDMLMFDSYPIVVGTTITGGSLKTMYEDQAKYRTLGLAGNDGTGQHPIPVGHYTENFADTGSGGHNFWPRLASESETRLQQFSAWTFGEKLVSSFVYNSPNVSGIVSEFFNGNGVSSPTAAFNQIAETNRQSRNLGPALVRLLSTDIRFVPGQNAGGANPTPTGMSNWSFGADPYMTAVAAANLGTLNGGRKGDALVAHFKPLDESFDGSVFNNETYFMITNGLTDANGSAAQTRQQITLNFNFLTSGINSLERLNRNTGLAELIDTHYNDGGNTIWTSLGGSTYQLQLILDGGTGDLFKFYDGAPFVGAPNQVPEPVSLWLLTLGMLATRRWRRS